MYSVVVSLATTLLHHDITCTTQLAPLSLTAARGLTVSRETIVALENDEGAIWASAVTVSNFRESSL